MDNISISVSEHPQNKDITLLAVKGFIDTTTAPEFEKKFLSVLGEKKFKLVVDLKDVNYISSAGWGIFISEIKRIRNQKGDLILAGMNPEVSEVFELLEFNTILKSFPNIDAAVKKGFDKG
jgi:anti-anti-sigma factor